MSKSIYHNHHIIPRHAGGTDHPDNLVRLTLEEHIEAHRKLYEEYGRWQDKSAYQGLSRMIGNDEIIRLTQSEGGKKGGKIVGKMNKGRKHTEEHKQKNREAQTGRICSEESKRKISESKKGKPPSEETKRKISEARMGVKRGPYKTKIK